MIASRSPPDKRRQTSTGGSDAEELPPSPSGDLGGASRTTSTATTDTTDTAVSSVTFAAEESGGASVSASENANNSTSGKEGGRRNPPARSCASFASDASFVIEHNDDVDDAAAEEDAGGNDANAKKAKKGEKPLEKLRHHFASHQTNNVRSASVGSGMPPAGSAAAPAAHGINISSSGGRPPLSAAGGNTSSSRGGMALLAPLRRHFASHSEEPTAVPHVHARPATSPAAQATLTKLIAAKRLSLRPVELEFLEEVCRYGGETEVRCAIGRLEDDGLFFDCHGGGGVDDGGDYEDVGAEDGVEEEGYAEKGTEKTSPGRRGSLVREEKKLDGTDDLGEEKEEEEEEDEYAPADRALYTELTASKVDTHELEHMNRQLKEKCSIVADDVDVDDDGNSNTDGDENAEKDGGTPQEDNACFASKPIQLQNSTSMYEPRAVHSNSLDPSESDLEHAIQSSNVRSSSEGVVVAEAVDEEEAAEATMAKKKAKARKMWTKLGSAARMAALANRRAQHRTARTRSATTGSLPETSAAGTTAPGIVDAVPGQGQGLGITDSQTSTSTSNIASIWRAHETGLSVTSLSSERRIDQKRRSMLQLAGVANVGSSTILTAPPIQCMRRSVSGGGGGGANGNSRRAAYRNAVGGDSFLSVGSLGDVLVDGAGDVIGPTTHNAEEDDKVFRRHDEDAIFRPDADGDGKADDKLEESDDELFEDEIEADTAGLNTSTASAPVPESPGKIARPAGIGASSSEGGMDRRSISVGSVRSVKFAGGHTLHEFSEDDMQFNKIEIPADRPPPSRLPGRPPTILRRSSSLNRLPPSARRQVAVEMSRVRLLSADVTPVSSPSAGSIPSIRHAHPIRSDSAISLSSVTSAAPSLNLHRANPIRSDSLLSVGSAVSAAPSLNLHRANPIRSNSVLSMASAAPSLNLHRANPLRSQSFLSEIGDVGLQRNISVADSVLTFDESPINSPRASMSADEPEDEAVSAAKAAAAAAASKNSRPVMMRMASKNNYEGEGFEIADMVEDTPSSPAKAAMLKLDSIDNARKYRSLLSEASESMLTVDQSFKAMPIDDFVRSSMFRRTLSDDGLYGDNDSNGDLFDFANENDDWDLESEPEVQDAWNVLQDEYAVGYSSIPFFILGTSADDVDCHPHVLSPPLMESLQPFFPYAVSEDNFYLKFSLVRDGASLHTLLQNVRGAKHTIVAIETVEGEVFGAFCSSAWRKNWNYFGSGEAFLWRMRRGRDTHCHSIIDQAQMESELDVFPWTGENNFVQLCTSNKIAIGGGTKDDKKKNSGDEDDAKMDLAEGDQKTSWDMEDSPPFGFGLAIEDDLLNGTSSPCLTFNSPPLSKKHADGSPFEILNLEVWTLTPCIAVEEAEKLELSRLFLEGHRATSM